MHWARRCEAKWRQAFYFFTAGIPCNFATLAVSGWIKFDGSPATAVLVTVIMGLATLLVAYFMTQWSGHLLSSEEPRVGPWLLRGWLLHGGDYACLAAVCLAAAWLAAWRG
jgi:hypothetical protein